MPLYDYACNKCKSRIEVMHPMNHPKKVVCKKCKKEMTKIPNMGTFILKGSGWASDGYVKK